jgi:hypothetical protein
MATGTADRGARRARVSPWPHDVDTPTGDPSAQTDFTARIVRGPNTAGLDLSFALLACLAMAPYDLIRDDLIVSTPTERCDDTPRPQYWRGTPNATDFTYAAGEGLRYVSTSENAPRVPNPSEMLGTAQGMPRARKRSSHVRVGVRPNVAALLARTGPAISSRERMRRRRQPPGRVRRGAGAVPFATIEATGQASEISIVIVTNDNGADAGWVGRRASDMRHIRGGQGRRRTPVNAAIECRSSHGGSEWLTGGR